MRKMFSTIHCGLPTEMKEVNNNSKISSSEPFFTEKFANIAGISTEVAQILSNHMECRIRLSHIDL